MSKPKLTKSIVTIDTIPRQTTSIKGSLDVNVFIGTIDVHAKFLVLKLGAMVTPIILGQPWKRQYNGIPNWKQEGLNFETKIAKYFTPFFNNDSSNQDQQSDKDDMNKEETTSTISEEQ